MGRLVVAQKVLRIRNYHKCHAGLQGIRSPKSRIYSDTFRSSKRKIQMLQYQAVDSSTLELLKRLFSIDFFNELRLVGGTSLALQIGHRKSIDLDLFGKLNVDAFEINNALTEIGEITILRDSKNIHIYLVNGIKVDIVNYSYPWLQDLITDDGLRLAGYMDIAAMKLAAITGRGSKKDFIDLHFLLNQMSLEEMLNLYTNKFKDGSLFLVLKSLIYFDDAEQDELPDMLVPVKWEEVKAKITAVYIDYMNTA
jgi:predicted nucleotidyltransferase component of viral defense system